MKRFVTCMAMVWTAMASAQTADQYIAAGTNDLALTNWWGADTNFNAALAVSPTNETANLLKAATRLLVLPETPAGSNFLVALGFPTTNRYLFGIPEAGLPKDTNNYPIFPANYNSTNIVSFCRTNVMAAIAASLTNLANITDTNYTLSLSSNETYIEAVTLDYGDIQMLRALLSAAQFFGYTANANNLSTVMPQVDSWFETHSFTWQLALATYPNILALQNTNDLALSKSALTNAIAYYFSASAFIRNRPTNATNRLFELDTNEVAKEALFRTELTNVLLSLNAPTEFKTNDVSSTIYAGGWFSGTNSLNSFLPKFNGDAYVNDSLPDYTFGGILPYLPAYKIEAMLRKQFYSYAGIYAGYVDDNTFGDPSAGYFAAFVSTNQQVNVVGYDVDSFEHYNGQAGGIAAQFSVSKNGDWQLSSNNLYGVLGFDSYGSIGKDGSFYGQLQFTNGDLVWLNGFQPSQQSPLGPFQNAAGYYGGTWSGTFGGQPQSGTLMAVLSANGYLIFCAFNNGTENDGGLGQFGSNNQFITTNANSGTVVSGTLNTSTLQITGTSSNASGNATWTMTRSANVPFDVPPVITQDLPLNITALAGANVSFTVNATGSPPMCYQWYFNGTAIPYAVSNTLTVTNLQANNLGTYSVSINNAVGGTNTFTTLNVSLASLTAFYAFTATTVNTTNTIDFAYTNTDGAHPLSLILSSSTLYGTTMDGGANGNGTVFKVSTNGSGYAALHTFTTSHTNANGIYTNADGAVSISYTRLVLLGSTLYGTTSSGGTNGNGTVFKVNTDGNGFGVLHCFSTTPSSTNTDGAAPFTGLVLSGSTLYGATQNGGTNGNGTVFKVNTDGSGFATLHTFAFDTDGAYPYATLVLSGNMLYGTANSGGTNGYGTVFEINTNGSGFTTLYIFAGENDGMYPFGDLVLSGNTLYGTTQNGGTNGYGTVFKINTDGSNYTVLHSFSNTDGAESFSGLALSGNTLYGTTGVGGSMDNGVVFSLSTDGSLFNVLYNFTGSPDGANPIVDLVISGNVLYGTTIYGGVNDNGTIFSLVPDMTKPVIGITAPTPGQFWSNATFTVAGTATDNVAVAGVYFSLNNSPFTLVTTTNNWTNWSAVVTLAPGTNTIAAYAVDTSGNVSSTNSATVIFVTNAPLVIGHSQLLPNGQFQLTMSGGTFGQSYILLASTNLVSWTPISGFVNANPPIIIYDPNASQFRWRFYRVGPLSLMPAMRLGLTSGQTNSSNGFNVVLYSLPGLSYEIEASTNLVNWVTITNFTSTNSSFYFSDPQAKNYRQRFYRAVMP